MKHVRTEVGGAPPFFRPLGFPARRRRMGSSATQPPADRARVSAEHVDRAADGGRAAAAESGAQRAPGGRDRQAGAAGSALRVRAPEVGTHRVRKGCGGAIRLSPIHAFVTVPPSEATATRQAHIARLETRCRPQFERGEDSGPVQRGPITPRIDAAGCMAHVAGERQAMAHMSHAARRNGVVDIDVHDGCDRLVATGRGTFFLEAKA